MRIPAVLHIFRPPNRLSQIVSVPARLRATHSGLVFAQCRTCECEEVHQSAVCYVRTPVILVVSCRSSLY